MENVEFKNTFDSIAKEFGFAKAYSGWFKESAECIAVLDLQKSNYSNYYELNIKIFVQGAFGNKYARHKNLVKRDVGNIFTRQPNQFRDFLDLEVMMDNEHRKNGLERLFADFIVPWTTQGLTRAGIREMGAEGKAIILPAVQEQLDILDPKKN